MSDEASAIRTGFVRQRRNLLVTTLVLLAFQKTGASIDTLNVFGNTIELAQPLALATPLWLAWLYFLVRYYQYFHDLGDRGLASAYLAHLVELGKRQAVKELTRTFKPNHEGLQNPEPPHFDVKLVELAATPPEWVFQVTGTMTTRQRKTDLQELAGHVSGAQSPRSCAPNASPASACGLVGRGSHSPRN